MLKHANDGGLPFDSYQVDLKKRLGPPPRGDARQKARWSSLQGIASEAVAILVNAPTLGGWYLLQGQAGAISCTTGIYALLFSGLSGREGERGEISVARIECFRTR